MSGTAIEASFHGPTPGLYTDLVTSGAVSSSTLEKRLHEVQFAILSKKQTPAHALLGAKPTERGEALPAVVLEDQALGNRMLTGLPARGQASELLPAVAAACGLTLVGDYHTRSQRVAFPSGTGKANDVLEATARQFELVVRQSGPYLLVRQLYWPDRDEEEAPFPIVERWIAEKREGRPLELEDILLMSRLGPRQLDALTRYSDPPLRFNSETGFVRRNAWVMELLRALSPAQLRLAQEERGLPIVSLNQRLRAFVVRSVGTRAQWTRPT